MKRETTPPGVVVRAWQPWSDEQPNMEDSVENIDDFNRGVGLILGKLYQHFPVPVHLDLEGLEGFEDARRDPVRKARRVRVYGATMAFLRHEKILRYSSSVDQEMFTKVVLTSKGLAILSKSPEVLTESQIGATAGEILLDLGSDMLKKGAWEGMVTTVRNLLGG